MSLINRFVTEDIRTRTVAVQLTYLNDNRKPIEQFKPKAFTWSVVPPLPCGSVRRFAHASPVVGVCRPHSLALGQSPGVLPFQDSGSSSWFPGDLSGSFCRLRQALPPVRPHGGSLALLRTGRPSASELPPPLGFTFARNAEPPHCGRSGCPARIRVRHGAD